MKVIIHEQPETEIEFRNVPRLGCFRHDGRFFLRIPLTNHNGKLVNAIDLCFDGECEYWKFDSDMMVEPWKCELHLIRPVEAEQ